MLEDLLVFSRDLRLNLYEHRLRDVLAECLEECRPQAAARGVALRLECPADATARLDKLKVKQAVVNVLRNAIDASPPSGDVVVRCGLADGAAEIAVTDRGPGIPAADRAAIFTPFFTTKEHGSGLGLAIAREFAEAHGGAITAESRDGGGATFVLRLPREGRLPREVRFSDRRREDFARQLAAKRAGESARASKRSVLPSTIRSAAIGPSAPLVSMPQPPWPASQKKPRTRGSSPTTGTRSGAKVRSPDHLRRSVCGTSEGASVASRAKPRAMTSSSGRTSHGSIGSSSIGLSRRPPDSGAK